MLLSIDPGGTTGWATFVDSKIYQMGHIVTTKEDKTPFYQWVRDLPAHDIELVVAENYIIRPPKAGGFDHQFSPGLTIQLLGILKYWCFLNDIPIVLQQSAVKTPAAAMAFGEQYKKKPDQHFYDAVLHGVYYLMNTRKVKRSELGSYKP